MKNEWSKIWKEFNLWWSSSSKRCICPNWQTQKRKLGKLIQAEFPTTNIRKLWAYLETTLKNKCIFSMRGKPPHIYTVICERGTWAKQQNIIKKAVAAQG